MAPKIHRTIRSDKSDRAGQCGAPKNTKIRVASIVLTFYFGTLSINSSEPPTTPSVLCYIANRLSDLVFGVYPYTVVSRLHHNRRRPLSGDPVPIVTSQRSIRQQAFGTSSVLVTIRQSRHSPWLVLQESYV